MYSYSNELKTNPDQMIEKIEWWNDQAFNDTKVIWGSFVMQNMSNKY